MFVCCVLMSHVLPRSPLSLSLSLSPLVVMSSTKIKAVAVLKGDGGLQGTIVFEQDAKGEEHVMRM